MQRPLVWASKGGLEPIAGIARLLAHRIRSTPYLAPHRSRESP